MTDANSSEDPPRISWWTLERLTLAAGGLALLVGVAVVGWVEPRGQIFFPRCWIHETTGLLCPGCGSTRALHAMLHGDWRRAWELNPLAVLAMPFVAGLGVRQVHGVMTGRWWPNPLARGWVLGGLMLGMLAFGIGRNLR